MKDAPPRRLGRGVVLGGLLALATTATLRAGLEAAWRAEEAHEAALRDARATGRREGLGDGVRERAAQRLAEAARVAGERKERAPERLHRVFVCAELQDAWRALLEAARMEGADAELADLDARFQAAYGRARRDVSRWRVLDLAPALLEDLRATLEAPDPVEALGAWVRQLQAWIGPMPSCRPSEADGFLEEEWLWNLLAEHRDAVRALKAARGDRARVLTAVTASTLITAELRAVGRAALADCLEAEARAEEARAAARLSRGRVELCARAEEVFERSDRALTEVRRVQEARLQAMGFTVVFVRAGLQDAWRVLLEAAVDLDDDPRGLTPTALDERFQSTLRALRRKRPGATGSCSELTRARESLQELIGVPDLGARLSAWVRDWRSRVDGLEASGSSDHEVHDLLDEARDARRRIEEGGWHGNGDRVAAAHYAMILVATELRALSHSSPADAVQAEASRAFVRAATRLSRGR